MKRLAVEELQADETPDTVPVFPLPDHVFLPDLPTPYRVFEPRYVQLVEDLLERPESERWVAIPRLAPGWEKNYDGSPGFLHVATVGRLIEAIRTDEGFFHVVVRGLFRAQLQEVASDRLYRTARIEPWPDVGDADAPVARATYSTIFQLFAALRAHVNDEEIEVVSQVLEEAPDLSTGVFRLGSVFIPDPDARQKLLESREPVERAAVVEDAIATVLAAASGMTSDTLS